MTDADLVHIVVSPPLARARSGARVYSFFLRGREWLAQLQRVALHLPSGSALSAYDDRGLTWYGVCSRSRR
jgi:hypothetical protein